MAGSSRSASPERKGSWFGRDNSTPVPKAVAERERVEMVQAGMDPCVARALAACKHAKSVENAKKWHGKSWFGSTKTGAVAEGQKPVTDVKRNEQLAYLARGGRVSPRVNSDAAHLAAAAHTVCELSKLNDEDWESVFDVQTRPMNDMVRQPTSVSTRATTTATPSAAALIRAAFSDYDTNQDGKLSRDEWKAAFGSMQGFDAHDLDGDGFVDLEEYVSYKLHRAARVNNAENLELLEAIAAHMPHLVDNNDPYGVTALWDAARKDNTDAMRILLGAKADLNHKEEKGMTPIFIAAKEGNADAVQLLLESGANVNSVGKDRKTPVSIALAQGHREIALLLRKSGGVK